MLEILVSLRKSADGKVGGRDNDFKKAGDIIVAKKSPAKWGSEELKHFLVMFLNHPELEQTVDANGGLAVLPFAIRDKHEVTERSSKRVDLSKKYKHGNTISAEDLI